MSETLMSWLPEGSRVCVCARQWLLLEELLMVHTCPMVLHGSTGYWQQYPYSEARLLGQAYVPLSSVFSSVK